MTLYTCSKHNYSGIDSPCPDCVSLVNDYKILYDAYCNLLDKAIGLYAYYPNNYLKSAETYFKCEIELKKQLFKKGLKD